MTKGTWSILLIPALALTLSTGCQLGKFSMPNMAWWKKNRSAELDASYIEPPSLSLAPSDSDFELKTAQDGSMPEIPRELYETSPPAGSPIDSAQRFSGNNAASAQDVNSFVPPSRSYDDRLAQQPIPTFGSGNPLSPKLDSSDRSMTGEQVTQGLNHPSLSSRNGSFQKDVAHIPSSTYDMGAGGSLQPSLPNQGQPYDNSFKGMNVVSGNAPDSPSGRRIPNPYLASAEVAGAGHFQREVPSSGYQYESTPHPSFESQPRNAFDAGAGRENRTASSQLTPTFPNKKAMDSESLGSGQGLPDSLLQGQGVYAPGSVTAPAAIDPARMMVQPQTSFPTSSGGSFQPN